MTLEHVHIHEVESEHQEGKQELWVMVPDSLDTSKTYRVLYLLPIGPGRMTPGEERFGNELDELPKLDPCNKYDVIVCRPSFAKAPWFRDPKQIAYVKDVVVPTIETLYPTLGTPEGRLLMGYSKGGSGSFKMILQHPDFFGYAASWDGNMHVDELKKAIRDNPGSLGPFTKEIRLVLAGGEDNYWQKVVVQYHEVLKDAGVLHHYDDTQAFAHAWSVKWMAPTLEALMKLRTNAPQTK